jgi:predicted HicB family RNase H-like nuclease
VNVAVQPPADTDSSRTIIVRLAVNTHKALRIRVAEEDTSIQKWVEALVERELGINPAKPTRTRR